MVLGIRSKSRKSVSVQVEYLIHIQEIKPWPLSNSKKSNQSVVFLQWENGDQPSGSFTSEVKDGKIEFSESFRLPATLIREVSKKNTSAAQASYHKNMLEFFLYEPRKDKPMKGQVLGTALVNLADYGVTKETVFVSVPLNCKKSGLKHSGQPVLFLSIQAFGNDGIDSVFEATGEEEEEELEIAAFTDEEVEDDISSHSSRARTSPMAYSTKIEQAETSKGNFDRAFMESNIANRVSSPQGKTQNLLKESQPPSLSIGSSFNPRSHHPHGSATNPYFLSEKSTPLLTKSVTHGSRPSSSSLINQDNLQKLIIKKVNESSGQIPEHVQEPARVIASSNPANRVASSSERFTAFQVTRDDSRQASRPPQYGQEEANIYTKSLSLLPENGNRDRQANGKKSNFLKSKEYSFDIEECRLSSDALLDETSTYSGIDIVSIVKNNKLKHTKSVQITSDSSKSGLLENGQFVEIPKRTEVKKDIHDDSAIFKTTIEGKQNTVGSSDSKGELESQIEILKEELREAAAVEVGLYSVVAEHGSSANKIHAPARRLSRFYSHACKSCSKTKKSTAAKAVISGFILVSKACGNDVPRLTFWLSNAIMLRAVVGQTIGKPQGSVETSVNIKTNEQSTVDNDSLDEPQKFMVMLENFEAWIFSRIVESVWWQTMTPHMQPAAAKASSPKKASGRKRDQDQGSLSIELWKKAFKDACQRLCPSRAVGHECGCLPVLARLVMEQLVSRLDVAMFNAILREHGEEMPTDPVSDPISDSKVLPIAAGRSSFGAGAQLKNAIGSWSRCLTDIFDIDDGLDDKDDLNDEEKAVSQTKPFKAFRLLNALSDLMMIPFEMLADKSTRKEVCPALSATLIKMILYNFVPDEFCPTPIPGEVFEALDAEDDSEENEESITCFPCTASPTVYSPPSTAFLRGHMGDSSGSSVLRKSYTSDDELDELDSPFASIVKDNFQEKRKDDQKVVRYELLRESWKDSE